MIDKVFNYRVRDDSSKVLSGHLRAQNRKVAIRYLRNQGYYVIEIEEKKSLFNLSWYYILNRFKKVNLRELAIFLRQFATIVESGIPLIAALKLLSEEMEHSKMKATLINLRKNVEQGMYLADALEKEKHVFPEILIKMVATGEQIGVLAYVLNEMSEYFIRERKFKRELLSIISYPAIILVMTIVVGLFIVTNILPKFVNLFAKMRLEPPLLTKILLATGTFIVEYWYLLILLFNLLVLALNWYYRQDQGRYRIDSLLLKLPIVGTLIKKIEITRFTKSLSLLSKSGLPIIQSLDTLSGIAYNSVLAKTIREAKRDIQGGMSLTATLKDNPFFSEIVIKMIKTGEETGRLEEMLLRISELYEEELREKLDGIMSILEPALMLLLGLIIIFIIFSTMMPMYQMINQV